MVATQLRGWLTLFCDHARIRRVSRTLTVFALILVLAGCGDSDSESSEASETAATVEETRTTTETTQTIVSSKVRGCLEQAAGLADVREQEVGLWRGLHDDPAFAIVVRKLAKPAKAPIVVAGAYVTTGRFKVAAEGTGLPNWGLEADFLVQQVADCLGS
jgi:hypothetical protein